MTFQKSPMMVSILALFLILVGATAYRIITALETHPGLVVEDAYLSGEAYGQTLGAKKRLAEQGWTLDLSTPMPVTHQVSQSYQAKSGQHGKALKEAVVTAYFYRPLEPKHDFSKLMYFKDNTYNVEISLPLKGRWDVVIEVTKGDFLQRTSAKLFAD